MPSAQTKSRNVLRQKGGPALKSILFTERDLFKHIITPEMCDIILRETNRKAKRVYDANSSAQSSQKVFQPFNATEFDAFLGILIAAGVQRDNRTNLDDMWNADALPLVRAAMSRDRFKMMLRFVRFDNENTRAA